MTYPGERFHPRMAGRASPLPLFQAAGYRSPYSQDISQNPSCHQIDRIHKNAANGQAGLRLGCPDQVDMSIMKGPHRWHESGFQFLYFPVFSRKLRRSAEFLKSIIFRVLRIPEPVRKPIWGINLTSQTDFQVISCSPIPFRNGSKEKNFIYFQWNVSLSGTNWVCWNGE